MMDDQGTLLELSAQGKEGARKKKAEESGEKKLRHIDRTQINLVQLDVESLIDEDHAARGIWEATERLDLKHFEAEIRSVEGAAGRCAWPPQLLVAIWLYGYSRGITSARELERQMAYEPGLMWLTGLQQVNHHTLSDFRVNHWEALTKLFSELLMVLTGAGLVTMRLVAHDGTKIRAQAGVDSQRREETVRQKLEQMRTLVEQDPQAEGGGSKREQAARERARREREQRAQAALQELEQIQLRLKQEDHKARARVSVTDPEARRMKHGDNAILPSYNAQISTDADSGVIVGVGLNQSPADAHLLLPAIDEIQKTTGRMPDKIVADGGYTNLQTIQAAAEASVDFYGSLPDPQERSAAAMKSHGIDPAYAPQFFILQPQTRTAQCPAGQQMKYLRTHKKRGDTYTSYRAEGASCMACAHQTKCCPNTAAKGRTVSFRGRQREVIAAFRNKMATEEGRSIYRRRGAVAEFPFAQIKERMRLRKFRLFGLAKSRTELMWAALTYNVMIWIRLAKPQLATAAA